MEAHIDITGITGTSSTIALSDGLLYLSVTKDYCGRVSLMTGDTERPIRLSSMLDLVAAIESMTDEGGIDGMDS
jgi:hypothetical protein